MKTTSTIRLFMTNRVNKKNVEITGFIIAVNCVLFICVHDSANSRWVGIVTMTTLYNRSMSFQMLTSKLQKQRQ